jgi:hypothetical protein
MVMPPLLRRLHAAAVSIAFLATMRPSRAMIGQLDDHNDRLIMTSIAERVTQEGGYVDPSLILVSPSPLGAERGMMCRPSDAGDANAASTKENDESTEKFWVRVPFSYQLTRDLALETLTSLVPPEVLEKSPLSTLDDAALLVLLVAHLRGATSEGDKWYPYLASLPNEPGCGWWHNHHMEGVIHEEVIDSALTYVERVSKGMAQDYGPYLASEHWPEEWKTETGDGGVIKAAASAIEWALCIVSSRGTAASPALGGGSVRLVPLADMFNHDVNSDGFIELSEEDGENLLGTFEVRRTKKEYMEMEEITVNYNLADYTRDEWFLSHGFLPPETWGNNVNMQQIHREL